MDFCKYVNVFHGCGEITPEKSNGLSEKWFFIKAQCGNTNPSALIPFGGMSVGPYSGGYPTGYGNYKDNYQGLPAKFQTENKLLGFTHLHQSGTGYVGYFYNYIFTCPKYDNSDLRRTAKNEKAVPGYYCCTLDDILCELTADNRTAYHRYTFGRENGKVELDFEISGLNFTDNLEGNVSVNYLFTERNLIIASFNAEGVTYYVTAEHNGKCAIDKNKAVIYDFGKTANIKISISSKSIDNAKLFNNNSSAFDTAEKNAYELWNEALLHINIDTKDDKIKRIFYSNLYHSLIKPSDRCGDCFIYENEDYMTDFTTLWDMYKTEIPLIFISFKDIAEKTVNTLINLCNSLGYMPNNIGLTKDINNHSGQAKALASYVLMTAYYFGIDKDANKLISAITDDMFAPDKDEFIKYGKSSSMTRVLDMAECCGLCADIADEIGNKEISAEMRLLSNKWIDCFDKSTGLLKEESDYYEGSLYNYSFRQMRDMNSRIEIAGGKEKFVILLDKFFGYNQQAVKRVTNPDDNEYIAETMKRGIFEGFNNESDTEAPFSYIYADRHDRVCEIIREGMKYNFTEGRGGIPGNNDSGALSSYYVFMALGLFPVAGQDLFLIGSPFVDKADIKLSNNKNLKIIVKNNSIDNIYIKEVKFNNHIITDYKIPVTNLMQGGIIEFSMTGENNYA